VIAVIGAAAVRGTGSDATAVGLAASIATEAARSGSRVELVGKVGDDPSGDALLIALSRQGVGHVAILRDAARPTPSIVDPGSVEIDPVADDAAADDPAADDPAADDTGADGTVASPARDQDPPALDAADVGLALRYLPELAVIVAVHQPMDVLREAVAASRWAETTLIVVVPPNETAPDVLPDGVLVIAAEAAIESASGSTIGRYAAAIDQGTPARQAYDDLVAAGGAADAGRAI
jgi:sugar/nucleoside kinase (ribokinase family)